MRLLAVLSLLAALCLGAIGLGGCGGGGGEDPQQVLEGISFAGIKSADFAATLSLKAEGEQTNLDVSVNGRAETKGLEARAKVEGTARGKPVDFEGGVTLFAKNGFVNYQGTEYEIGPYYYEFARSLFLPALSEEAEEAGTDLKSCGRAGSRIHLADLVEDPDNDGNVEVAGTETTKVSGQLDFAAATDALIELAEDPRCRFQYEALSPWGLSKLRSAAEELQEAAPESEFAVYVDGDGVVRRLSFEASAEPKDREGPVSASFDLSLSEVNGKQKIETPASAKPVTVLFAQLGIDPFEFLGFGSGGEAVRSLAEKVAADAFP